METENIQPLLSILIPSIPERKELLDKLLIELNCQITECSDLINYGHIEILVENGQTFLNGGRSIGKKRQLLLDNATGKYILYLDDDENISPNYIETMLRLCSEDKDVCTFRAIIKLKYYWGLVDMRLLYKENDQATPEFIIRRTPWHINAIKTEFAKLYSFEDKNNAEDYVWMEKVLTHCTTEAHTDRILFQYNHGIGSEADRIENSKQ